ncbi:MAG: histidine kinase [Gammaproteobacteria bacterium]|nr:MAG: histidine kinase [Gammaproteobacteria bacterium]
MSTKFLVTDENPSGYKLEDILMVIRNDILQRATKIMTDNRPESTAVMNNNIRILTIISEGIELAKNSSEILDKAFGPSDPDKPRIGEA